MATELIADCPRCGTKKVSFIWIGTVRLTVNGIKKFEIPCRCRNCDRTVVFLCQSRYGNRDDVIQDFGKYDVIANDYVEIERYISVRDVATARPPEHVPDDIALAFNEAATNVSVECWNSAGSMFRACLDLATRPKLPPADSPESPKRKVRRDLGLRLQWLFDQKLLPDDLRELSACIREDGNDGAHQVNLSKEDAQDMLDFTVALLERLYTQPGKLKAAQARRDERRKG